MFTEKDLAILKKKNISLEKAQWQIEQFKNGVAPIKLSAAATPENGITIIEKTSTYIQLFDRSEIKVTKFVPASGAASRMFKTLFEFRDVWKENGSNDITQSEFLISFFEGIKKFAFYPDLDKILNSQGGMERLLAQKEYGLIVDTLLSEDKLAYGVLPKGLLKFHFYAGNIGRTPFEEHLVEGAKYSKSKDGIVYLHFTVSPEHIDLFKQLKDSVVPKYEDMYSVKYDISFSVQKSSTDTIAVTPANTPFYDKDGDIFFRPGGHGALIENLNELDSDIVFIKNIDNVVPEKKLEGTVEMKKALAGLLLSTQEKVFSILQKLENNATAAVNNEAIELLKNIFCRTLNIEDGLSEKERAELLFTSLNRPLRVCGMVKNSGEPGGGPFLVIDNDGQTSPQVVESSQIDLKNAEQESIFRNSTHFNPVDLVCAVKNYKGEAFDLTDFVDNSTCFISSKSKDGKDLKALELPGLWNGAMAGWNSIFVEVPARTFTPVKTVNDLLRDAHQ